MIVLCCIEVVDNEEGWAYEVEDVNDFKLLTNDDVMTWG